MISGTVIFCDDIRLEVGNKYSIMGLYGDFMEVSSFPATIPQFAFMIRLWGSFPVPQKVEFRASGSWDSSPVVEATADVAGDPPNGAEVYHLHFPVRGVGLDVPEEDAVFTVEVKADDKVVCKGMLPIRKRAARSVE